MIITGFQPLSLLDYPGIICSIVFTQGCPFRCVYCHNPDLVPIHPTSSEKIINEETILETLKKRKNIIEGVCITGGEPTIHPDLPEFIKSIKRLGMLVKLDTNGIHPRLIERLLKERMVDFIAMDLKHTWERYPEVIGRDQANIVHRCRETFRIIQESSIPHEFRTTVYSALHSEEDLSQIARQLREGERYALQQIRYEKTLQPNLSQTQPLDLEKTALHLRQQYPFLQMEVRV